MSYMDPVLAAQKSEHEARLPFITPRRFWTAYEPQADGTMKPVDMVEWIKKGQQNSSGVIEKISRYLKKDKNGFHSPEWEVLKGAYDSWKAGETAPVNGTPLAAWPGGTPDLVMALATVNIRSVEDLEQMEDSSLQKLALPGLREKQKLARAFLQAQKATAGVSAEIVKLREVNESQARELTELRELIERFAIKKEEEEAPKRGPGRPRKVEALA